MQLKNTKPRTIDLKIKGFKVKGLERKTGQAELEFGTSKVQFIDKEKNLKKYVKTDVNWANRDMRRVRYKPSA